MLISIRIQHEAPATVEVFSNCLLVDFSHSNSRKSIFCCCSWLVLGVNSKRQSSSRGLLMTTRRHQPVVAFAWCHCVSDALVFWSGLFLLYPRVCSQHRSSAGNRFACLCEWQRVGIMLLSLCTEAGWMFSSRWDHRGVGSTLKNFHWRPTFSAQAVTHVVCLSETSTCPNFIFRSFANSINNWQVWNQHALLLI